MTSQDLRASVSANGEAGFTLAELLVALALLAVVLGLATGGIRFGVRAWEATRAIDRSADVGVARDVLARCLKAAMSLSTIDEQGRIALAFEGINDRLTVTCPLDRVSGSANGGYYRLDFHLTRSGSRLDLVATTEPFRRHRGSRPDRSDVEVHMLVGDVAGLDIRYFGDLGDGAAFYDSWSHASRLPALVTIAVRFAERDRRVWPELAVAIGSGRS